MGTPRGALHEMGCCFSAIPPPGITAQELELYEAWTFFTKKEVVALFKIHNKLAGGNGEYRKDTFASKEALMSMPEMKINPFNDRIFTAFSENQTGSLSFDEFVDCFSHFHPRADKDAKLKAAFRIYDCDMDGLIGVKDVRQVLKIMIGNEVEKYSLKADDLDEIAKQVVGEADMDNT